MSMGIIGHKLGMTQIYATDGSIHTVTVLEVGPCPVSALRLKAKDGYSAVQLAFEPCRDKVISKPELMHLEKIGIKAHRQLREFRLAEDPTLSIGEIVTASIFNEGDLIDIVGTTKGHGFTGGMVRWGWHGGRASRGSMFHRRIGSNSASAYPSRVLKGKSMPGHMGHDRRTSVGITIVKLDAERNLLYVRGSVPGPKGGLVMVLFSKRSSKKKTGGGGQ